MLLKRSQGPSFGFEHRLDGLYRVFYLLGPAPVRNITRAVGTMLLWPISQPKFCYHRSRRIVFSFFCGDVNAHFPLFGSLFHS